MSADGKSPGFGKAKQKPAKSTARSKAASAASAALAARSKTSAKQSKSVSAASPASAAARASAQEAVDAQLERYRTMRDFGVTAEPSGAAAAGPNRSASGLPFVIQKHAATRLHYDFRLGWRGVLKSWAVAKGPSYVTRDRRLAVEVEDHPIEYGGFEGTIPKGQYGGGTVLVWDQGTWEPHGDVDEGLRAGSLKFSLCGEKLKGKWTLVRMGGRAANEAKPNWLLIKEHDDFERHEGDPPITEEMPDSVVTGRGLAQIGEAEDHVWNSRPAEKSAVQTKAPTNRSRLARAHLHATTPPAAGKRAAKAAPAKPADDPAPADPAPALKAGTAPRRPAGKALTVPETRSSGLRAVFTDVLKAAPPESFPDFIAPQLATAAQTVPPGEVWVHELKLDGYRVQLHIRKARGGAREATLYTRNGLDWTHRMRAVADAAQSLAVETAILDGEVVVLNEQGGTSFSSLQAAFDEGAAFPLTYFAFDLLHLDGHNLRGLPLEQRKALLAPLLEPVKDAGVLLYSQHLSATAAEMFAQACELGAEGIISKLAGARYTSGRTQSWLKLKCVRRQDFIIGGFTLPKDRGAGIGSLLLGYYNDAHGLVHCGRTGTGFSQATQRMLRGRLEALKQTKSPYARLLVAAAKKDAIWVRPELVCEVEFATWTNDGLLRHAAFQGLREDKFANEVVAEDSSPAKKLGRTRVTHPEPSLLDQTLRIQPRQEEPQPAGARKTSPSGKEDKANHTATAVGRTKVDALPAGLRLTHPDKVLDPESGVTKQQLAEYFQAVGAVLLPHIKGRPLSVVRCPDGTGGGCFFQKHAGAGLPASVGSVDVPDRKGGPVEQYISVDTVDGIVGLAQLGGLELHPWGSLSDSLEKPDRLIFDLDPDEAISWPRLVESARAIRAFLEELKLKSYVKTTGGKGLHLVVPIEPTVAWPEIKLFTRGVAAAIESSDPALYLIKMTKAARKNRIFLDYLRNERGATAVAPYSPRARKGMRVAMPLAWDELDAGPPVFAVANLAEWQARLKKDPWAAMMHERQKIRQEVLDAVLETAGK